MTTTHLENSIRVLNDFCADSNFTVHHLTFLRLNGLILQVNAKQRQLKMLISTVAESKIILFHLTPTQRLYQLLTQHFETVDVMFGKLDDIENAILLDTIILLAESNYPDLRDINSIGARLRRALNVALQGHIGVLKLHNDDETAELFTLLKRDRVKHLFEKYAIIHCHHDSGKLVYVCQASILEECKKTIIVI